MVLIRPEGKQAAFNRSAAADCLTSTVGEFWQKIKKPVNKMSENN